VIVTLQTRFIYGGIAVIVAIAGLVTAANASEATFYIGGLVIAALALAFCWLLIKRHFDHWERDPARPRPTPHLLSDPDEAAETPVAAPRMPQAFQSVAPAARPAEASIDPQTRGWLRGVLVGVLALLGLLVAAAGDGGFAYWGGLVVFGLAVLKLFRMIGRAYDAPEGSSTDLPTPPAGPMRWIVGAIVGLVAVAALFAASGGGTAYYLGILVAVVACGYIFHVMKVSFDEFERQ